MGVTEPVATFSACFGAAFMMWHPTKYAGLLAEKIEQEEVNVWLVNTGWIGGGVGVGKRISLQHTRAIIDAIHDESLLNQAYTSLDIFDLQLPSNCKNVPSELLNPSTYWVDQNKYWQNAEKLANLFIKNFKQFESDDHLNIQQHGPNLK